jgi:DMSO/TMAO reductase YedYZ molybdopterin-dependent catalytic subunit
MPGKFRLAVDGRPPGSILWAIHAEVAEMRGPIARFARAAGLMLAVTAAAATLPGRQPAALAQASGGTARLEISGAVRTPLFLSAADLKAMPRTTVQAGGQGGQLAQRYEGVALSELLRRAGVPQGEELGGPWLAAYAVAAAADGYRVVFSLAELDAAFGNSQVLVADTLDGAPLSQGLGPFRLVVPGDQRAARWVRSLKSITVAGM